MGEAQLISDNAGAPQFNVPCLFMQSLLCLPHANVDVEQSVNLIKLKHTALCALLKVKRGMAAAGGHVNFSPQ